MHDPIDKVVWKPSRSLNANHYNPNVVFTPELKLLEHNILTLGWTQAIMVNPDGIIIDGFHRWRLSMDSPKMRERWAEEVPCVTVDVSPAEAIMSTVRMNRAKGTHVAIRMSGLVQLLVNEHGLTLEQIQEGIGATRDEVRLLTDGSLLKHRDLDDYRYSKAWVPIEVPRAVEDDEFEREDAEAGPRA